MVFNTTSQLATGVGKKVLEDNKIGINVRKNYVNKIMLNLLLLNMMNNYLEI